MHHGIGKGRRAGRVVHPRPPRARYLRHMPLTNEEKSALLARLELFAGVPATSLDAVAERAGEAAFEDGRHIVQQGQLGTGLWVVIDGTVRVVRGSDELGHLGPGELFGEVAVFDQHPRMASVIADGDVRCLGIASWDFLDLLEHDPTLTRNVLRVMAERLRRATDAQRH